MEGGVEEVVGLSYYYFWGFFGFFNGAGFVGFFDF